MPQNPNPRVLVVHPGTQHSKHLAQQLWDRNLLACLCTSFSVTESSLLNQIFMNRFSFRVVKNVPSKQIKLYPYSFFKARLRRQLFNLTPEDYFHEWAEGFQEQIPDSLIESADYVVGFDTASWILAQRTKKLGKTFILDQTAVPHASLFSLLNKAYSSEDVSNNRLPEHPESQLKCFEIERELADYIVHASSFTKRCLIDAGVSPEKLIQIPYGIDESFTPTLRESREDGIIRFVYVGSGGLHKGLPFLFEAFSRVANGVKTGVELHVYGFDCSSYIKEKFPDSSIFCHGKIEHNRLSGELSKMDILFLPSIVEGFGLVALEAMSCALPVVLSKNVGAADLVNPGVNGILVDAADSKQLSQAMEFFINEPEKIETMGLAAKETAKEMTWERYGDSWSKFILVAIHFAKKI